MNFKTKKIAAQETQITLRFKAEILAPAVQLRVNFNITQFSSKQFSAHEGIHILN